MFEHFTSVACEFSQPLLFTPQKSTSMQEKPIFSHCEILAQRNYGKVLNRKFCLARKKETHFW
jgi:hypothetical protein